MPREGSGPPTGRNARGPAGPERVVEALAAALQLREEPGRTMLEVVTAALEPRTSLVLMDNCETHSEACAGLAAHLLRACPRLRILATTRQPLGMEGETI